MEKICKTCGIQFHNNNCSYCSRECRFLDHTKIIKCDYCGKQFSRVLSAIKENNYCSLACKYLDPKLKEKIGASLRNSEKFQKFRASQKRKNMEGVRVSKDTEFKKGWQYTEKGREIIKKRLKTLRTKTSKPELKVKELLESLELPYEHVGGGQLIIGSKNPDFVRIDGEKCIIEVFGTYWHDPEVCKYWHQTEEGTKNYYGAYGYEVLVIWEDEVKDLEKLSKKILTFTGESLKINTYNSIIEGFNQLSESEFEGSGGMTLKFLMDLYRQNSLLDLLSAKILELEDRVNEVEGKPKKVLIKTLGGKQIEKEEK